VYYFVNDAFYQTFFSISLYFFNKESHFDAFYSWSRHAFYIYGAADGYLKSKLPNYSQIG